MEELQRCIKIHRLSEKWRLENNVGNLVHAIEI